MKERGKPRQPQQGGSIRCDLRDVMLYRANLQGADLRDADVRTADLRVADLTGANLLRTKLR